MTIALYMLLFSACALVLIAATTSALIQKEPQPDKAREVARKVLKELSQFAVVILICFPFVELILLANTSWKLPTLPELYEATTINLLISFAFLAYFAARIPLDYNPDAPPS